LVWFGKVWLGWFSSVKFRSDFHKQKRKKEKKKENGLKYRVAAQLKKSTVI